MGKGSLAAQLGVWALAAAAPAMAFYRTATERTYQTDIYYHMARGRAIVTEGQVDAQERFSYALADVPHPDPNWLGQVCFYLLDEWGGMDLVRLGNSLLLAATFGLFVALLWRRCQWIGLAAGLGIFAFFGLIEILIVRPQTFSLLLFVLVYLLLDVSEKRRRVLFAVPLVFGLWANLHAGFPTGFVLLGAFLLGAVWEAVHQVGWRLWQDSRSRDLALCLAASLLTPLVNPYGWHVYEYVLLNASMSGSRPIVEWDAPGWRFLSTKMWVMSVLLLLLTFALAQRRPTRRELALIVCFLPLSMTAVRMLAWWELAVLPVLAAQLGAAVPLNWKEPAEPSKPSPIGFVLFGLLVLLIVAGFPMVQRHIPSPAPDWPPPPLSPAETSLAVVADYLRAHPVPDRRIYCRFEWGEYVAWLLAPDGYRIFLGGQIPICPPQQWDEFVAVLQARADWQQILDRYGVNCLILDEPKEKDERFDPPPATLLRVVRASGRWREMFRDGNAVLFVREAKKSSPDGG